MSRFGVAALVVSLVAVAAAPAGATSTVGFLGVPFPAAVMVGDMAGSACSKAIAFTAGLGLTAPAFKDVTSAMGMPAPGKDRVYHLIAPVEDLTFGPGVADVCGFLTSVAGIGPRCGMSKGYGGVGFLAFVGATVKVSNLGWKVSAGGTLLITGQSQLYDPDTEVKSKPATLIALAQAQGGPLCVGGGYSPLPGAPKGAGSAAFAVSAVYRRDLSGLMPEWNDVTDPVDPKDDGPSSLVNPWGDKPAAPPPKS